MTQIKIVRVERGDYEWLYFNDKLRESGHSLNADTFLLLIHEYDHQLNGSYSIYEVTDEYVDDYGGDLPLVFYDIPQVELELMETKG